MAADSRNEGALGEIPYVMDAKYRDLSMESVYEYGSRAGIWRLQRLFDKKNIPVTFFAAAVALERNPEVAAWLRDSAHEPCSHGWRWEEMWLLSREEEKAHMHAAIKSFAETCGRRPLGWYCRYGPSVNTRELLIEEGGFVYDSDAYNDDLPYYVEVMGGHMTLASNSLAKLGALIVDQHRIENVDANEAHLEALRELAAAPVTPPAPEPAPDPVVPPAAKPPHVLDITPEPDDTVRH